MRRTLLKHIQQLLAIAQYREKVHATATIVTLLFFEVGKNGQRRPPELPIGNLVVVPASNKLNLFAVSFGNDEFLRAEDEAHTCGLNGEQQADEQHWKAGDEPDVAEIET